MVIVTLIVLLIVLVMFVIVNFVLANSQMFQASFDIVFSVPLLKWSYTLEGIQFIYIIGGCLLLGVIVTGISTWVLDAKRRLKVRSLKKELKRLQYAVEEAKASLPVVPAASEDVETVIPVPPMVTPVSSDVEDSAAATPEDITKSFEHVVQEGDFLQKPAATVTEEPSVRREQELASEAESQPFMPAEEEPSATVETETPEPPEPDVQENAVGVEVPANDVELSGDTASEAELLDSDLMPADQDSSPADSKRREEE